MVCPPRAVTGVLHTGVHAVCVALPELDPVCIDGVHQPAGRDEIGISGQPALRRLDCSDAGVRVGEGLTSLPTDAIARALDPWARKTAALRSGVPLTIGPRTRTCACSGQ